MTRIQSAVSCVVGALLAACADMQFSLPGVAQNPDGQKFPGKVIWHDLITDTPEQTRAFYSGLLGWTFQELPLETANYTLIYHRGRAIGGMVDQNQLRTDADISQWVVVISVEDVERATAAAVASGGEVITAPTSLGERGDIAVVADSDGAAVALLQTRDGDPDESGMKADTGDFLWDELWSVDPPASLAFYSDVIGYRPERRRVGGAGTQMDYYLLTSHGQPRAGLRQRPRPDIATTWVSYLRVTDSDQLDSLLSKVENLGGRILIPATDRPSGGRVALIAGPSGAGIALQTWNHGESGAAPVETHQ